LSRQSAEPSGAGWEEEGPYRSGSAFVADRMKASSWSPGEEEPREDQLTAERRRRRKQKK
jgi:hypothetical protein